MTIQLRNFLKSAAELIRTNKLVRYSLYAVLFLATAASCFGLGERFGHFIYLLSH